MVLCLHKGFGPENVNLLVSVTDDFVASCAVEQFIHTFHSRSTKGGKKGQGKTKNKQVNIQLEKSFTACSVYVNT